MIFLRVGARLVTCPETNFWCLAFTPPHCIRFAALQFYTERNQTLALSNSSVDPELELNLYHLERVTSSMQPWSWI